MNNKRLAISFGVGAAISLVALYFSFRRIPAHGLFAYLESINYWWTLPALGAALLSLVLRVWRWQIIVSSIQPLSYAQAFSPTVIGFMMNCVLPGRVGELARPAILRTRYNASFFGVLATVAAERVFDLLILLVMLAVTLSRVSIDPDFHASFGGFVVTPALLYKAAWGMVRLSIVMVFVMVLVSVPVTRRLMERMILALPEIFFFLGKARRQAFRSRFCGAVIALMDRVAQGFGMLKSPGKMVACLLLSVLVWLLLAAVYWLLALGCPGIDLNAMELTAVMVIVCFFISLPSVPGFWGLWEAGGIFAMALFGASAGQAAGYTLVNHVLQLIPATFLGLACAVATGVNVWQISRQAGMEEKQGGATWRIKI